MSSPKAYAESVRSEGDAFALYSKSSQNNIYYIPLKGTRLPAGGVWCLGRHVSAHVCHLMVRYNC
jgi:hypothetical protein